MTGPVPFERRGFPGGAAQTILVNTLSTTDLSITVASASRYDPGPSYLLLDSGNANAEKVYYTSLAGSTFTIPPGGRGVDGSQASTHQGGSCTVRPCYTATDADEANRLVNQMLGGATSKGLIPVVKSNGVIAWVAAGADGFGLVADSTQTLGVKWAAQPPAALSALTKGAILLGKSPTTTDYLPVGLDGQWLGVNASMPLGVAWGPGPLLLAKGTSATYTPGAAMAALDATLLSGTVNVPASGRVLARVTAAVYLSASGTTIMNVQWASHGGTTIVAGSRVSNLASSAFGSSQPTFGVTDAQLITGLTPYSNVVWDLDAQQTSGAVGSTLSNVTVEIWAA